MGRSFKSPVRVILVAVFISTAALGALMAWNVYETRSLVETARLKGKELKGTEISSAKEREDFIGKRYENDARGLIVNYLLTNFASAVTLLGALCGGLLALYGYMDARRKEALDRAANDLKDTLTHLASKEAQERMVGVVGLQYFLVADRNEFHRAALTALVAAARTEKDSEVLHSLRIAIEQAMRVVASDVLSQVSWERIKAQKADLTGLHLESLDLRDADLQDAQLAGAWLSGANLTNAQLQGAKLNGAHLAGADLTYADLAGASMVGADLTGAKFNSAKVLNLDLDRANLEKLDVEWETVPWSRIHNWRTATFDPEQRKKLIALFGPAPSGPRVLMVLWEIPPFVAGGTWTACYHFVRDLLRRGADLTIVVPWNAAAIATAPFGTDVKIVALGIQPPQEFHSPYSSDGGVRLSPYGAPSWSPYFGLPPAPSPYGLPGSSWSPYAGAGNVAVDIYGTGLRSGGTDTTNRTPSMRGSVLFRLIDEFRQRFLRYVDGETPDVIHAHDWVTFEAARDGAQLKRVPWIAHVHSTEIERRPEGPDPLIELREQQSLKAASRIVAPSKITREAISSRYRIRAERIDVVPNVLSAERIDADQTGRFESKRVIFLGRLSHQKGLDRFLNVAALLRECTPDIRFEVYGGGNYPVPPEFNFVSFRGALTWERRGEAFRDASVLVVPSRAEPFGMVILEGMLHRVPVIYAKQAGAAEVLTTGIQVDAGDLPALGRDTQRLLDDLVHWENVVEEQAKVITDYPARGYEDALIDLWQTIAKSR